MSGESSGRRPLRLVVVSAGLGAPSTTGMLADLLGRRAEQALAADAPVEAVRIELRDHARAVAEAMLSGFPAGELAEAVAAVEGADALVVASPAFQGSFSGLFKSFMDLVDARALRGTPVLLAATGGTERHSLMIEHALRPLFSYLGALTVPTGVYAATGDFGGERGEALTERAERAAGQLAALLGLGRGDRAGAPERPADAQAPAEQQLPPMSDGRPFTAFTDLLGGAGG